MINNVLETKEGKKYQVHYLHSEFGSMVMKITNPETDFYDDLDELEDDMVKIINSNLSCIVCVNPETGDSLILPKKIIEESVMAIIEV